MSKIIANIVGLCLLLCSGNAMAQSFASGTKTTDNVAPTVQKNTDVKVGSSDGTAAAQVKKEKTDAGKVVVDTVEKKFGPEEKKEETIDNTYGAVISFHFEGDNVVFDDKRNIFVYYDNYKVERGLDGLVRCTMRIYVLNDLKERINSLGLKLKWPEISTTIQMSRVTPGVRTYTDVMLLGEGCYTMDKSPTIEVNRCRVKGMSEDKCADAIRWFRNNQ